MSGPGTTQQRMTDSTRACTVVITNVTRNRLFNWSNRDMGGHGDAEILYLLNGQEVSTPT